MNATAPFSLTYSFDYDRFDKPDLQAKAKSTLGNFFGFVRQTFDGLLSVGRSLQDLYFDSSTTTYKGSFQRNVYC